MQYSLKYLNDLPMVNTSDNFIVIKSAKSTLADDWFEYMKTMIKISLKESSTPKFKTIRDSLNQSKDYTSMSIYAQNLLGIGDEFTVIEINMKNGKQEIKAMMGYEELVDMYFNKENVRLRRKFIKRAIIDRFFAFMWSKKKLLYPILNRPSNYQRSGDWKELIIDTSTSKLIEKRFTDKDVSQENGYEKIAIYATLVATSWYEPNIIEEDDLKLVESSLQESDRLTLTQKKYYKYVLNELRFALINEGSDVIEKPRNIARDKVNYDRLRYLNWINLDEFPNLTALVKSGIEFPTKLKRDGLSTGTINSSCTHINNFFKYIILYYPSSEITVAIIDDMFEPDNEHNLYNILTISKSVGSVRSEIGNIIKFLVFCDLYSIKARKNTPKPKKKTSLVPYRTAMPKEMIQHIVDIIKNRPPNTTTKWSKKSVDCSWWKHDVYPVYPMMMLFGYFIPVRGEQVRHLCRENSFIFHNSGAIESIVINTDKNVNRKYLQEIPCVWEDLQKFVPFLKWHKEYYKHIPKVQYHDDDNSPWEDIEPLFITPQVLKPISRGTHFDYHKKVLCQYQLEVILEAKKNGHDNCPKVAWAKNGKDFFKDIDELNNCSSNRMNDIEVMYDLHSLRVTGATRYLESGLGLNMVMQLTGHTTADTLIRIYTNLTRKEKEVHLKSAIDKIYFGDADKLVENTSDLLRGELARAYESNKDDLEIALKDNALFSLARKVPANFTKDEYEKGTKIALSNHPSTWFPMIHGICPAVKCPDGRERKCSLCPYLITGKLFLNGITLKVNQVFANFTRDSLQKDEEFKKGYKNQALAESLEVMLEEILGWMEIIDRINLDICDTSLDNNDSKALAVKKESVIKVESIETELAYLKNAYESKIIGVEQDIVGLKYLTIQAIKVAVKMHDYSKVNFLSDNEEESIDYLMKYYSGKTLQSKGVSNFISSIKETKKLSVV